MTHTRAQLDNSMYPDELAHIARVLDALNQHNCLMCLDGELSYHDENANRIAIFWFDSEAETWRVQIGLLNE
jgi:hypothetical protein